MPPIANNIYIAQTRRLFHCDVKIKIPAHFNECILERGFALMEHIDSRYNSYTPGSIFHNVNSNSGQWTAIDENVAIMLQSIAKVNEITHGAYDITVMPLLRLWGFYRNGTGIIPSNGQIQQALENTGNGKIQHKGLNIMTGSGQEIVTGSFIKAFAIDMLVKQLTEDGFTDAVINAGGSSIYAINNTKHPNWNINLPHPFCSDKNCGKISIANACFSMSATMHGFIIIDGKKYGHIINAKTGYPSANVQSGVICKSAFLSDVLSTALFSLHEDDFETVATALKEHFDFEAYLITQEGSLKTTGYSPFKALSI